MKLFQVIEKVGLLAYQLDIPKQMQIYSFFSIAQLEPCLSPDSDLFVRSHSYNLNPVYLEGDTDLVKSSEVECLISKRQTKHSGPEYLVS